MKISLTMRNNLKHVLPIVIFVAGLMVVALTNARYETSVNMTGTANFPTTVIELSQYNSNVTTYNISTDIATKLEYQVTNNANSKTNNNNLQYYFDLEKSDGTSVANLDIKVREKPAVDDGATFDTVTSLAYTTNKGYGPITLKCDGTTETKIFEIYAKGNSSIQAETINVKVVLYVESITSSVFNFEKTSDLTFVITNSSQQNRSIQPSETQESEEEEEQQQEEETQSEEQNQEQQQETQPEEQSQEQQEETQQEEQNQEESTTPE